MIVKCTKCDVVEDITGENLELLAKMISLYNPKPRSSDYVAILSIIKGDCIDRERHIFSFDEFFMQDIDDMIYQHGEAIERLKIYNGDLLKTEENINKNLSDIKELEARAKEIEGKIEKLQEDKDNIRKEIDNIGISISDIKAKLHNLTGIDDINIWI